MAPRMQKALVLPIKMGLFSLQDVPVYRPGPTDVLVKVESAALNPVEWKIQTMGIYIENYPAILGTDAAGVVEETGENVKTLVKGDRILFQGFFEPAFGTFQQYSLPERLQIPPKLSFDQAATLPVAISTAVLGMYNQRPESTSAHLIHPWNEAGHNAYAGKPILIVGGSSSVGQCVIQMAKLSGFSPIITTASLRNTPLLSSLGASHVLDRNLSPTALMSKLGDITGGTAISFVYDAISLPDTQLLAYTALSSGGTLVLTFPKELPAEPEKASDRKTIVEVFGSLYIPPNRDIAVAMCQKLGGWLESGVLKPNRVEVVPGGLAAIPAGLERLKSNGVSATKLIVHPQEFA
ncbi:GroES-like protein [Lentinus tigrinus ALCF2SS1-7]|uniref:GroES-like protein n=1 Tax=Lentinus tigrinus ALCF2SS1-7 TaxID=1328758 RepID=UPI001166212A|nr:GroES-like protein [Lentinus tigrinus ALCF2SS1-7]